MKDTAAVHNGASTMHVICVLSDAHFLSTFSLDVFYMLQEHAIFVFIIIGPFLCSL